MGAGGGGDPYSEGRSGEVVVDEQDQCGVQNAQCCAVGRLRGQPRPEAWGEGVGGALVRGARRQGVDKGWDEAAGGTDDGVLGQVEAERVGSRRGDHGHS